MYYTLRHCNARGCEYRRRETLVRVVLIMGHCHQWRHQIGVSWLRTPFTFILHDDRLLYPALFFQINNFASLCAIII